MHANFNLWQVEDGERLGCASLASWSLKTYVATKRRIERVPPRVDKSRGGAGVTMVLD